ncbi:adhesion G protein-coupled receptor A3 [Pimephales promelas]|nr:adhesion G protein-coupled receptor A3 [Pimephales promelas]
MTRGEASGDWLGSFPVGGLTRSERELGAFVLAGKGVQNSHNIALEAHAIKASSFNGMTCTVFQKVSPERTPMAHFSPRDSDINPERQLSFKCNVTSNLSALVHKNAIVEASLQLPPSLFSSLGSSGQAELHSLPQRQTLPPTGNSTVFSDGCKRRSVATPVILTKIGKNTLGADPTAFLGKIRHALKPTSFLSMNQTYNASVCQAVGIVLHYSTLATALWSGVTARNIYKQVTRKAKRYEELDEPPPPPRPMLRFYLIGGGIPIIVCGITAAANIKNYGSQLLAWEPSLGAFYGPAAFIVFVDCMYFLSILIQLLRHPKRRYELKEQSEEQQHLSVTEAPSTLLRFRLKTEN